MIKIPKDGVYIVREIDVPLGDPVELKGDQVILLTFLLAPKNNVRLLILEPHPIMLTEEKR